MSTKAGPVEFAAFWLAAIACCVGLYVLGWQHVAAPLLDHVAALWHQLVSALQVSA